MEKLLLHTCCAPCFSSVFEQLSSEYEITIFFCNPNIKPAEEYARRLSELRNYPPAKSITVIESTRDFLALPNTSEGGEKCKKCFEFRLRETAKFAKENGFDIFATTLTVSPHKNAELINSIGQGLSAEHNIKYLPSNFKKNNGFLRSLQLSKEYNLYRQNYCGCTPSPA